MGLPSRAAWRPKTPCSAPSPHRVAISWCRTTPTGHFSVVCTGAPALGCGGRSRASDQPRHRRRSHHPGETKAVWIETPTNPLLNIADIAAIVDLAHWQVPW